MTPQWFHDSAQDGYCMPETDYSADGGTTKGRSHEKAAANQKTRPEWVTSLEAFKIPDIAGDRFLNGCKVRGRVV